MISKNKISRGVTMKKMRIIQILSVILIMLFVTACNNPATDAPAASETEKAGENLENKEDTACDHNFIDMEGKAATCEEDGYSDYKVCMLCGEKKDYSIIPGGHDYVTVPEKPATATSEGHTEYRECSKCQSRDGYEILEITHTHSLTEHADGETNPLFFTCKCGFSVVTELRSRPLIDQLTDTQYENFSRLYNMFKNRESSCTFTESIDQAEVDTFYYLLQGQCPELFLLVYENSRFSLSSHGASWNPDCMSEERYSEVCDIMIETMIRWDADCTDLDDVEKIKYMVDWLNKNTVYSSIGTRVRSLYGGIIDREIACVGYSQIFAWALSHFDIPCASVSGFVPLRNDGHMWNLVKLDGEWYQVDPGWGTVEFNGTLNTHYAYVNVTDEALGVGSGRVYYDSYAECGISIPKCTATAKNVARLEGYFLSSSSSNAEMFESMIKSTLDNGGDTFTVVCGSKAIMDSFYSYVKNAVNTAGKYGVKTYWTSSTHDETTGTYFVSVMLARPNFSEIKLTNPNFEEGVGYKLAISQKSNAQTVFFSGGVTGKYLSTTADPSRATDVFYKKVDGGFRIWFMDGSMKKYVDISVGESGTVQAGISVFPTAVYNVDSETGAIVASVDGTKYWLGTYNNYSTVGASKISYITGTNSKDLRATQFPAELVVIEGTEPLKMSEPPIAVGEGQAYKLVMDQKSLGKKLYFQGWRTRNFPASTTDPEKSPLVFLESDGDGYQLYYLWGDNKMYINVQGFGADGVSIQLQNVPGAPFKYNETLDIYTVEMYGEEYYIGCYGDYDNFSISNISYITGENAEKIGVSQFPAYLEKVN